MQMKKQNWKRLRKQKPCRACAGDHETSLCLTRRGTLRETHPQPLQGGEHI